MPTEAEIKVPYITAHKELEKQYYKYGLISLAEFNQLHGQNWNDMEAELKTASDYVESEPPRNPLKEIDELRQDNILLKAEIEKLKERN